MCTGARRAARGEAAAEQRVGGRDLGGAVGDDGKEQGRPAAEPPDDVRAVVHRHRDDLGAGGLQRVVGLGELDEPGPRVRQGEEDEMHHPPVAQLLEAARRGRSHRDGEVGRDEPWAIGLDHRGHLPRALTRGQGADEVDQVPPIFLAERRAERGHAALGNAVGEPPEHVARGVVGGVRRGQVGGRLRQARAAGAVSTAGRAVAGRAVRAVERGAARDGHRLVRHRRAPVGGGIGVHRHRWQRDPEPRDERHAARGAQEHPPRAQEQPDDHREHADEGHLRADEEARGPARHLGRRLPGKAEREGPADRVVHRGRRHGQRGGGEQDQQREPRLAGHEAPEPRHRGAARRWRRRRTGAARSRRLPRARARTGSSSASLASRSQP